MGYGQCLLNNGAQMTLNNGVHVYLDGGSTAHYTNQNGGLITSTSSNAGTITVLGNWINNASNVAFSNDGSTVLMSGANQTIGGTNSSTFDNLILSGSGTKQLLVNTSVGGGILKSGSLDLTSRPLDLNSHTLTITNSLTAGIIKTSGYILSETPSTPGYGTIQWNIGNASGSYEFPFGSFSTTYIPLLMNVNTAGIQTSTGNISASTYPTTSSLSINNRPLPSGVADLNNNCSSEHATKMLDRFWVINSNNYSTKPISSMLFSYQDNEWDLTASSTNTITENKLKVWNYNTNWQGISTSSNNPSLNQQTLASTSNDGVFTLGEYNQLQLQLIKADSVKCLGQSNGVIQFSVSQSGYGNTSFAWNGVNSPDTIRSNLAAGIYTITAIDLMGCSNTLTINLVAASYSLSPVIVASSATAQPISCITPSSVIVPLFTPSSNLIYSWSGPSGGILGSSSMSSITVGLPGNYSVIATNSISGCSAALQIINVSSTNSIIALFNADQLTGTAPLNVLFTNQSAGAITYTWTYGDGNGSNQLNASNTYTTHGTYTVLLTASNGICNDTYTLEIVVKTPLGIIPEIFTPNGDNVNDVFEIIGLENYPNNKLQIFNRWGNLIYTSSPYKNDWNGVSNSVDKTGTNKLPVGTYYYLLELGDDNKSIFKGFVQLMY